MTEIFILPISEAELISEEYCLKNFPLRMQRANSYRFREDKLRCIGAGALLYGIGGIAESDVTYNEYGKPICGDKYFSISHSGEYSVLALSGGIVGVDIECTSRKYAEIAKRVCTAEELDWLNGTSDAADTALKFFKLWTLKESIMKAEGKGLSMDPRGFSILPIISRQSVFIDEKEYFGESFELDGYMLSICSLSNETVHVSHIRKEML